MAAGVAMPKYFRMVGATSWMSGTCLWILKLEMKLAGTFLGSTQ